MLAVTLPAPNPTGRPSVTGQLLLRLRNCLAEQVARTMTGPAGRVYNAHDQGLPVMDGCTCETTLPDGTTANGDAWVRLVSENRTTVGTNGLTLNPAAGADCGPGVVLTIELGIMRCHPIPPHGDPQPPTLITDIALTRLSDKDALWRVISPDCCSVLFEEYRELPILSATWNPVGPTGDCSGSTLTFQVESTYPYTCP